jgi:hypothetical protein
MRSRRNGVTGHDVELVSEEAKGNANLGDVLLLQL